MSTGKAGCGDRPHWLFRPLFRFQGARPEGAQSQLTGQNSVHPEVRQPANNFAGNNFGYRSNFRMWKPPQERRATLASGSDQRNSAAQEAHTCRNQGGRPPQCGTAAPRWSEQHSRPVHPMHIENSWRLTRPASRPRMKRAVRTENAEQNGVFCPYAPLRNHRR